MTQNETFIQYMCCGVVGMAVLSFVVLGGHADVVLVFVVVAVMFCLSACCCC